MSAKPVGETKNTKDPRGQFGEFLRHYIVQKHGEGNEHLFGEKVGKTARGIRKWMEGANSPTFKDLDKVAKAMGYKHWGELGMAVAEFHKAQRTR